MKRTLYNDKLIKRLATERIYKYVKIAANYYGHKGCSGHFIYKPQL